VLKFVIVPSVITSTVQLTLLNQYFSFYNAKHIQISHLSKAMVVTSHNLFLREPEKALVVPICRSFSKSQPSTSASIRTSSPSMSANMIAVC
jgi:hypothetical protein